MATPEPVEPTAGGPNGPPEPTDDAGGAQSSPEPTDEHASREAANYRRRLRDTEAERDALRARVDEYERRDVEGVARELGAAVPSDLWTLMQLDELRVDGTLDMEAARTRITDVLRDRPTWRRQMPDLGAGARAESPKADPPGLASLLGKARR
jgi:hypothetical protein